MSPDPPYDVPISGAVADLLRRLYDEADGDGRGDDFVAALRALTTRLQTDPDDFGEERQLLPALGLPVRLGIVRPLAVEFVVVAARRFVIVRTFRYFRPG